MNFKREKIILTNGIAEVITIQTNEQNSLTSHTMLELAKILTEIKEDDNIHAAVITSDNAKYFSNGIDADFILNVEKEKLTTEIGQIVLLFEHLIQFDKPLIVEVTGYAMGGGAIITLAADYKYMLEGKSRIAFTEVHLGLPLPPAFVEKLKSTVHPNFLNEICLEGAALKASQAKLCGLITDISDTKAGIRKLTIKKLTMLFRLSQTAFRKTKLLLNQALIEKFPEFQKISQKNFEDENVIQHLRKSMNLLRDKSKVVS